MDSGSVGWFNEWEMNEDQIEDLKQFIDSRVGQAEGRVDQRMDELDQRMNALGKRMDRLDGRIAEDHDRRSQRSRYWSTVAANCNP